MQLQSQIHSRGKPISIKRSKSLLEASWFHLLKRDDPSCLGLLHTLSLAISARAVVGVNVQDRPSAEEHWRMPSVLEGSRIRSVFGWSGIGVWQPELLRYQRVPMLASLLYLCLFKFSTWATPGCKRCHSSRHTLCHVLLQKLDFHHYETNSLRVFSGCQEVYLHASTASNTSLECSLGSSASHWTNGRSSTGSDSLVKVSSFAGTPRSARPPAFQEAA